MTNSGWRVSRQTVAGGVSPPAFIHSYSTPQLHLISLTPMPLSRETLEKRVEMANSLLENRVEEVQAC